MFSANRIMSDYIANLADISTCGCDPMSLEGLREEFEVLHALKNEFEGLRNI